VIDRSRRGGNNSPAFFLEFPTMKSKPVKIALLLSLTLLLNGCGPVNSLFSLYQADDPAFEEGLIGTWQPVITEFNEDDKDTRCETRRQCANLL
jgi:hypothetical protein